MHHRAASGARAITRWADDATDADADTASPSRRPPERAGAAAATTSSLADLLVRELAALGVETAFGIVGGAVAPLSAAIAASSLRLVHCRHEAGAAFAATEASLASGRPCAVFCTTGPGLTNALTGLFAARQEGARVIAVSAATPAALRGRGAFQETGPHNMPAGVYDAGGLFHFAASVEDAAQIDAVMARVRRGLRRPGGFVAHLGIPTPTQACHVARPPIALADAAPPTRAGNVDPADVRRCVDELLAHRVALWVGFGARGASDLVRELAERLQVPVMSTPRGKGVFPERHPLYAGVTGFGGHASVGEMLAGYSPESVLVLGTALGEFSSAWDERFVRPRGFVQVDVDPDAIGAAYPRAPHHGIEAEIGAFLRAVLDALPARVVAPRAVSRVRPREAPAPLVPRRAGRVRPQALMDAIQRVVVDGTDAVILSEAGNSFAWANHLLAFPRPGRYRTSGRWASMGHAVAGVLGAGLGRAARAVALAGDGAMLMNNELSTAVQYGVPAVWIILNDAQYGMVEHGMRGAGYAPLGAAIPEVDFAAVARAMGADGVRVGAEVELDAALRAAMTSARPFVLDVLIDPAEAPPIGARARNLREQGVGASRHQEEG